MTLPLNYTLIRHGQSEQNRVFSYKHQNQLDVMSALLEGREQGRHETTFRLTSEGVKQAESTGNWLKDNADFFTQFYVSPHVRARETAALLSLNGSWKVDDLYRERDWGEASGLTPEGDEKVSPSSDVIRRLYPWLWKPQGGESLSTGVRTRVELVMDSLHRKRKYDNIIAVTHGEFMRVVKFVIEQMTPEQFNLESLQDDRGLPPNCGVLQYTRQNPHELDDVRNSYQWKRLICPWDESKSLNGGQWVEVKPAKYTDAELLEFVNQSQHIFKDELNR